MRRVLAVDIGASSGRHILGSYDGQKLMIKEIHRFHNEMTEKDGYWTWDLPYIEKEVLRGLAKLEESQYPEAIGIDTWGVDYVCLDAQGDVIGPTIAYRDPRTTDMMTLVEEKIPKLELYERTGIQFLPFNTIYQLMAHQREFSKTYEGVESLLMIPDFLNYKLTGVKATEYTNASTTQLLEARTGKWSDKLMKTLAIPNTMFQEPLMPKTILGSFSDAVADSSGFQAKVVLPPTHDTGAAFVAVPTEDTKSKVIIVTGTWSLVGFESHEAICTKESMEMNFTNEGGIDKQYRVLKNVMGLWLIQEVKRCYKDAFSFGELVDLARDAKKYTSIIDVDDKRFLKPENMIEEIKAYCVETHQDVPNSPGAVAQCVFISLAKAYKKVIEEMTLLTGQDFKCIHLIGGGIQNTYLNELIAEVTGLTVLAGPVEASAIGNILAQLIAIGAVEDLATARKLCEESFDIKKYEVTNNE